MSSLLGNTVPKGNPLHGNLTERAYQWIRDRILSGETPFGTGLSRRALAEDLGISIVPVGDALQRLENDGFVESRARVGTRVRIPTANSIRGHFVLREALESQSARIFAEKASGAERDEIRRMASQLDGMYALSSGEAGLSRELLFKIHKFHMRFHMTIAEMAECEELCNAIEKNQVLVFNWFYDTAFGNEPPPVGWHSQLAESLVLGDPEAADAAMRLHTRYRMTELLQRMESYFGWDNARLATFPRRARVKNAQAVESGTDSAVPQETEEVS
jgi:DNA-binding GntR family transcriptional regulator